MPEHPALLHPVQRTLLALFSLAIATGGCVRSRFTAAGQLGQVPDIPGVHDVMTLTDVVTFISSWAAFVLLCSGTVAALAVAVSFFTTSRIPDVLAVAAGTLAAAATVVLVWVAIGGRGGLVIGSLALIALGVFAYAPHLRAHALRVWARFTKGGP